MIRKVVSGGQTGADRAALDVALKLGVPSGGWCPHGRLAEDGPLASIYPLTETLSCEYSQRTEWNVRDSDGTLVLHRGRLSGGTAFTIELAEQQTKPCLVLDLTKRPDVRVVLEWVTQHKIQILNVAGPRESSSPGIYGEAFQFLHHLLSLNWGETGH